MNRRNFLISSGALLGTMTLAGCMGETTTNTATQVPKQTETESKSSQQPDSQPTKTKQSTGKATLEIETSELTESTSYGYTEYTAEVTVKNTGAIPSIEPEIDVKFFDEAGDVLDTNGDSIYRLKPGQSWETNLMFLGDDDEVPTEIKVSVDPGIANSGKAYAHPDEIEVTNVELDTGNEPAITADVTNTTGGSFYVGAYGQFLDENGTVLGSSIDAIDDLSAGETWSANVEALFIDENVAQRVEQFDLFFGVM